MGNVGGAEWIVGYGFSLYHMSTTSSESGWADRGQGNFFSLGHELGYGMRMWKGNGNTTTLTFSLKGLDILHQERRGQVNTIVIEHCNSNVFHKSGTANKQRSNQSIIYKASCILSYRLHSNIALPTNWTFASRRKRTSEHYSDGTLQHNSLPQVRNC